MKLKIVEMTIPEESNIILGQSHFIKSVEDIYDALVSSAPEIRFGIGFCEASGECLVRFDGNDEKLKMIAADNCLKLGCGHSFNIIMKGAYPINVLTQLKTVPEVCTIFSATGNSLQVIVAESEKGCGILGVIDGSKPKGLENEEGVKSRKDFLRLIGYKS